MNDELNRRGFLKAGVAGLGAALGTADLPVSTTAASPGEINLPAIQNVRIGIIGMGGRGNSLMGNLLKMKGDCRIKAVCDIYPERAQAAQQRVVKAGQPKPDAYSGDQNIWKKLCDRDDLDAVIIATYWEWHTPMAVYAMKAGKYAAVEVPAAYTLEECRDLVNTSEQTGIPCMMLENWSFRSDNLAVLNMIRKGLLGRIVHCHCAHSHDCIDHWFFESGTGNDRWPAKFLVEHNRDQYPSHQLGPVISWMDINCGDYFDYITSTATDSIGINEHFAEKFGPDHPNAKRKFAQGDIVTTTVRTKKGKSIVINYDMQLPRPYDNRWLIQGTRGLYNEQRDAVYLKGVSPKYHQWEPFGPYHEKYRHFWTEGSTENGGHGGTDFLELKLFVEAVKNRTQPPIDVYDSVIMCVHGPLSEISISKGGAPVKVPDFTKGKWRTRKPRFAIDTTV
ncbi:MAG: Gfo/Idh/MocA family protein [Planctomycetota bacterium]|jgi:predicted dehydrogenase